MSGIARPAAIHPPTSVTAPPSMRTTATANRARSLGGVCRSFIFLHLLPRSSSPSGRLGISANARIQGGQELRGTPSLVPLAGQGVGAQPLCYPGWPFRPVRYAGAMAATKAIELVTEIPGPRSREIG